MRITMIEHVLATAPYFGWDLLRDVQELDTAETDVIRTMLERHGLLQAARA